MIMDGKEDSGPILGKRKQMDSGNSDHSSPGSTLFVSNLPYSATSTDLQTIFSDFGPVRSAFVVLEENVSKGVGYVSFAIKEDASSAMATTEKDGLVLEGRKIRVNWADRKEKTDEKKIKTERKPSAPRPSFPKIEKDPNAIRTIVISGLPFSIDQKTLWKKIRKYDGAEKAELTDGETGVAQAIFKNPAAAARAVEKLHAHVFKGAILSVTLKKRIETLAKAPTKVKSDEGKASGPAPSRASRLIVRNLPWNISEQDLRALFLPHGPIHSITIPTARTEEGKSPRARGFAFVWFFSKKDAERAIAAVNGRAVAAGEITAPTMNKKERARLRKKLREQQKQEGSDDEKSEDDDEGEGNEEKEDSVHLGGRKKSEPRIIAVDWALSKEKWEETKAKDVVPGADEGSDIASVSGDEQSDSESNVGSDEEEDIENDSDDSDGMEDDEMDVDQRSDAEQAGRPALPQTDVGTTLFVRNVPFDATEDDLRTLFRAFGPMRYARITMDHETGRSRGTGFVCFWNKEDADKAIRQSELLNRETGLEAPKKNPFSMPSLLMPDPSSSLAQSLVLNGRTLDVTRAVTRDEAVKLKDEGERAREKADKRNMYLLREGVIFPNSPAAASVPPAELEKRTASFNARRALLKSNPSLFVSKTRMSIRQLPLFSTERSLKKLGVHAVRAFESEVKNGSREPLTADELRDIEEETADSGQSDASDDEGPKRKNGKRKRNFKGRDSGVLQAKIVRQNDRVDALTGKGKSRGYGFLEMNRHSDALRVLRWANNNPAIGELLEQWWKAEVEELIKRLAEGGGKKGDEEAEDVESRLRRLKDELERLKSGEGRKNRKTLIIEFSIENAEVVKRRKEKREQLKLGPKQVQAQPKERDLSEDEVEQKPIKRRRVPDIKPTRRAQPVKKAGLTDDAPLRKDNELRGLIGRKRKMRKMKGKV